jgi:hypothetical protein
MRTTGADPKPALRDRPLGKALAFLGVLVAAFLVARSCGSAQGEISKEEALDIAREEVAFEPAGTQIRSVPKGIPQRRVWAVSFYTGEATAPERVTVVQVDSETGEVVDVQETRP